MGWLVPTLERTVDHTINEVFKDWAWPSLNEKTPNVPAVDVVEQDDNYLVRVDLPGFDKKDIKISVEDNVLTISAEKNNENKHDQKGYKYCERRSGKFFRSFKLTEGVDGGKITASYKDGVLDIIIPKKEETLAKTIEIK